MKNSASLLVTVLAIGPALIATANAGDQFPRTGTAFEIAQPYADGGTFGGITSGYTGTALDVARDSRKFPGLSDRMTADWRMPPVLAKGN